MVVTAAAVTPLTVGVNTGNPPTAAALDFTFAAISVTFAALIVVEAAAAVVPAGNLIE